MPIKKPAVVLVHGAWHSPAHFQTVIEKLQGDGYEVESPALPSSAPVAVENAFAKDVAVIKAAIRAFTDAGKDVIVMMHSYGAICGSDAVAEFFEQYKNQQHPELGRILHLFYISGIILEKGTSLADDRNAPHQTDLEDGLLYHLEPYFRFYSCITNSKSVRTAIEMMKPQAAETFQTRTKYRGWADYGVPVTYLACEQDKALYYDPDLLKFLRRFKDAGVRDFTTLTIDTDHSPWLSKEGEFCTVLDRVLQKAME